MPLEARLTRDELELLSVRQLAELWRVSTRTVERRIADGTIPTVKVGGVRRIRAVDAARIAANGSLGYGWSTSTERSSR
jgi:excisionase family DNA binding protein